MVFGIMHYYTDVLGIIASGTIVGSFVAVKSSEVIWDTILIAGLLGSAVGTYVAARLVKDRARVWVYSSCSWSS
jgi:uncharacterized membrane protein YfcA